MSVQLGSAYGQISINAKGVKSGVGQAVSSLEGFKNTVGNVFQFAAGQIVAKGIQAIAGGLVSVSKSVVMSAARVDEMSAVLQVLGSRAGYSATQIDTYVQSIKEAGIRTDVAQNMVAQFTRNNLDLGNASEIARIAQDAAVISMKDSSEALDLMIMGITTHNSRLLRSAGLLISANTAYETYAQKIGKAVGDLSEADKVQAYLNATIAAGVPIAGAYAAAMEKPGKVLRSIPRYLYEIAVSMGEPFQAAFGDVVFSIKDIVKWFHSLVEEGGALRPMLMRVGAALSVITGGFRSFVTSLFSAKSAQENLLQHGRGLREGMEDTASVAVSAGTSFVVGWANKLQSAAVAALRWGINIATELAKGLVKGATSALTTAMNFIGSLLKSWLGPGSPPKVAPSIDLWGTQAFQEWIGGFASGDFGILQSLQAPLQSALQAMADVGAIGSGAVSQMMIGLTDDIAQAITEFNKFGKVGVHTLDQLSAVGGVYGTKLRELVTLQFSLARAVKVVTDAEERLTQAQDQRKTTVAALEVIRTKYNEIRDAASEAAHMQRAQLDAARASLELLREEFGAVTIATKAQDDIARKAWLSQRDQVHSLRAEYDAMQRAGADPASLAAKKAEIVAAEALEATLHDQYDATTQASKDAIADKEQAITLAEQAVDAAEDEIQATAAQAVEQETILQQLQAQIDAAQDLVDGDSARVEAAQEVVMLAQAEAEAVQKQIALQEQLLSQMVEQARLRAEMLADAEAAAAAAGAEAGLGAAAGGGGGAGFELPDIGAGLGGIGDSLTDGLSTAFETMKENMKGQLAELFAPLREAWETEIKPTLDKFKEEWSKFVEILKATYEEKIKPIIETIKGLIPPELLENLAAIYGVASVAALGFMVVAGAVSVLTGVLSILTSPVMLIIGALSLLAVAWTNNWGGIQEKFQAVWAVLSPIFEGVKKSVLAFVEVVTKQMGPPIKKAIESIQRIFAMWGIDWGRGGDAIKKTAQIVLNVLLGIFQGLLAILTGIFTGLANLFYMLTATWESGAAVLKSILKGIITWIGGWIAIIKGIFSGDLAMVWEGVKAVWDGAWQTILGIFELILTGIGGTIGAILMMIGGFISGIINFFKNLKDKLVGNSIVPDMLKTLKDIFVAALTFLLTTVRTWIEDIVAKFVDFVVKIISAITNLWETARNWFITGTTWIRDLILAFITLVVDAWDNFVATIVSKIATAVADMIASWETFKTTVSTKIRETIQYVKDKINEIIDWIRELKDRWITLGKDLIEGFKEGITTKFEEIISYLKSEWANILDILKRLLGIDSPSKKTAAMGRDLMRGLALGIQQAANLPESALAAIGSNLLGTLGDIALTPGSNLIPAAVAAESSPPIVQLWYPSFHEVAGVRDLLAELQDYYE